MPNHAYNPKKKTPRLFAAAQRLSYVCLSSASFHIDNPKFKQPFVRFEHTKFETKSWLVTALTGICGCADRLVCSFVRCHNDNCNIVQQISAEAVSRPIFIWLETWFARFIDNRHVSIINIWTRFILVLDTSNQLQFGFEHFRTIHNGTFNIVLWRQCNTISNWYLRLFENKFKFLIKNYNIEMLYKLQSFKKKCVIRVVHLQFFIEQFVKTCVIFFDRNNSSLSIYVCIYIYLSI